MEYELSNRHDEHASQREAQHDHPKVPIAFDLPFIFKALDHFLGSASGVFFWVMTGSSFDFVAFSAVKLLYFSGRSESA